MTLEKVSSTPKASDSALDGAGEGTVSGPSNLAYSSLDEEDRRILNRGEISTTAYVIGGVVGTYPIGLGIGHAIQGRYTDKGWIFTAGELGSIAVAYAGVGNCVSSWSSSNGGSSCSGGLVLFGVVGYLGFRIWEIIDVWAAPPEINRRYRELKLRMEPRATLSPMIAPTKDGAVFGLQMTF
jgi:hypothetical protein